MKRVIALMIALTLCLSVAACAAPAPAAPAPAPAAPAPAPAAPAPAAPAPAPAAPAPAEPAPAPEPEQITLTFWNIYGGGDANNANMLQAVADFEAANPNVKIEVQTFENEAYKTTIRTNISGNTAPDIYHVWGGGFSKPFVDAGKVLDISPYLNDGTMDKLNPGALDFFTYGSGVYGLTHGKAASGFFCNARLFEENGVKIPETWDELLAAVDAFNAAGITPIITTSREPWVFGMMFEGLALKAVGAEQTLKTLLKQEGGTFSDPQFLNAANKIMELVEKDAFNSDMAAVSRDEAMQAMMRSEGAMYYMGAWEASQFESDASVDRGNYDWIPFPTLPDGNGNATEFNGGMIDGVMINADTAHPAEAAAFVKAFCESMSRLGFANGNYMPAWNTSVIDESALPPVFAKINEYTNAATNYVIWWDTGLVGEDVVTYQSALEYYINGQLTAEEFIAELQKITP